MAEQYLTIPLKNLPALVEVQNYLRRTLPLEGITYQDPDTFHITLVAVEDTKDQNLTEMRVPEHLPIFGAGGHYIWQFATPENGYALVLRLGEVPQLTYLQSALYYEAIALGVKVSGTSYPIAYVPHVTLAYSPQPLERTIWLEAPVIFQIDQFVLDAKDYKRLKDWKLLTNVAVQEQPKIIASPLFQIAELIRGAPDVPLPADVDLEKLKEVEIKRGRGEPVFATLPIGKVDVWSRNGRQYKRRAVESLVAQVNEKKPEGRWGHLDDFELGTRYEMPAVRWLAAMLDEKTGIAWGKAHLLTEEAIHWCETADASDARVGTSIFGYDPMEEGGAIVDFRLITIDLANPERVGIPDTAAKPIMSSEMMAVGEGSPMPPENTPTPAVVVDTTAVQELNRVKQLLEQHETAARKNAPLLEDYNAMCDRLGVTEQGNGLTAVKALLIKVDDIASENVKLLDNEIRVQVTDRVKLESAREIVADMVRGEKPTTKKAVEIALDKVMEKPAVKALLATQLTEQTGPVQGRPATNPNGQEAWRSLVNIPAKPQAQPQPEGSK